MDVLDRAWQVAIGYLISLLCLGLCEHRVPQDTPRSNGFSWFIRYLLTISCHGIFGPIHGISLVSSRRVQRCDGSRYVKEAQETLGCKHCSTTHYTLCAWPKVGGINEL
jgi:hypothetical protein